MNEFGTSGKVVFKTDDKITSYNFAVEKRDDGTFVIWAEVDCGVSGTQWEPFESVATFSAAMEQISVGIISLVDGGFYQID